MSTIALPTTLIPQTPTFNPPTTQAYYRSKIVVSSMNVSPLMVAANPIFSILERLGLCTELPPIDELCEKIKHELYAFQSRLVKNQLNQEFQQIAVYFVCATIDELIAKNYLRIYGTPCSFQAFTAPSKNEKGPQDIFFEILKHLKGKTYQYLDLIELAYYCLITGFEGSEHHKSTGRQTLDNLIEELYQVLSEFRVPKPYRLFPEKIATQVGKSKFQPWIVAVSFSLIICSTLWYLGHISLEHKTEQLMQLQQKSHYG